MTKDLIQGFEADEGASRLLPSLRDDSERPAIRDALRHELSWHSRRSRAMPIAPEYGKEVAKELAEHLTSERNLEYMRRCYLAFKLPRRCLGDSPAGG